MTPKKNTPRRPNADELPRLSRLGLSRRGFLGVVLGTLPAAALPGGALARLWPESELDREVNEPWVLALDHETLWDPADDEPIRVPSLRVFIEEQYGEEELMDYIANELDMDEEDPGFEDALEALDDRLDLGLDTNGVEFENWYGNQLKGEAWTTWLDLPEEVRERFDIHLVEGDQPGSDTTYVRYAGKLEDLNQQLAAAGLNIVVIEQSPSCDLLFPGDPGY